MLSDELKVTNRVDIISSKFKNTPYNLFIDLLKKTPENNTIISQTFAGLLKRHITCTICFQPCEVTYESFFNINLTFPAKVILFISKATPYIIRKIPLFLYNQCEDIEREVLNVILESYIDVDKQALRFFSLEEYMKCKENNRKGNEKSISLRDPNEYYGSDQLTKEFIQKTISLVDKPIRNDETYIQKQYYLVSEMKEINNDDIGLFILFSEIAEKNYEIINFVIGNIKDFTYKQLYIEAYSRLKKEAITEGMNLEVEEFNKKGKLPFILSFLDNKSYPIKYNDNGFDIPKERIYGKNGGFRYIYEIHIKIVKESLTLMTISNMEIKDLIGFFLNKEKIEDLKCEKCKNKNCMVKKSEIFVSPNILILVIDRFKRTDNTFSKNNFPVNFDRKLDLTKLVENPNLNFNVRKINYEKFNEIQENKKKKLKYQLVAVCIHKGNVSYAGHYISYCYDYLDRNWYEYDDDIIKQMNGLEFCKQNKEAYILFYKKK